MNFFFCSSNYVMCLHVCMCVVCCNLFRCSVVMIVAVVYAEYFDNKKIIITDNNINTHQWFLLWLKIWLYFALIDIMIWKLETIFSSSLVADIGPEKLIESDVFFLIAIRFVFSFAHSTLKHFSLGIETDFVWILDQYQENVHQYCFIFIQDENWSKFFFILFVSTP